MIHVPAPSNQSSASRVALSAKRRDLARRAILTTGICVNSAVPSFALASDEFSVTGCLAGIAAFILIATLLVPRGMTHAILRDNLLRRAFLIVYGIRYVACLLPIAMLADVFVGIGTMIMASTIQTLLGGSANYESIWLNPIGSFVLTLIQGGLLNLALGMAALLLYLVFRMFAEPTVRSPDSCANCGFDLRMHAEDAACTECGRTAGRTDATAAVPTRFGNGLLIGVFAAMTVVQGILYVVVLDTMGML